MDRSKAVEMRLAVSQDLEKIAPLLSELAGPNFPERFPGRTAVDFCRWKYLQNPLGEAAVGVAVAEGNVVSLAAGVPKSIQAGGQQLLAFELGDFITAPQYRKRGIFSDLIRLVCREARLRHASLVYVRPNSSSFRILAKDLGFSEVGKIEERRMVLPSSLMERLTRIPSRMWRSVGLDTISRSLLLPSGSEGVEIQPLTRFPVEIDQWWSGMRAKFKFSLTRNNDYLNWRYIDCPTPFRCWIASRQGRITGYVVGVVLEGGSTGYLIDLATDPNDRETAAELLRTAWFALLEAGAKRVYTWVLQPTTTPVSSRLLSKALPLKSEAPLHVAMHFLKASEEDLAGEPWQLALGDFDGI